MAVSGGGTMRLTKIQREVLKKMAEGWKFKLEWPCYILSIGKKNLRIYDADGLIERGYIGYETYQLTDKGREAVRSS